MLLFFFANGHHHHHRPEQKRFPSNHVIVIILDGFLSFSLSVTLASVQLFPLSFSLSSSHVVVCAIREKTTTLNIAFIKLDFCADAQGVAVYMYICSWYALHLMSARSIENQGGRLFSLKQPSSSIHQDTLRLYVRNCLEQIRSQFNEWWPVNS